MSSRRANIRTWIFLLLALVPTTAVLGAGIWFWTDRGEELRASENSVAPIDTTVALFEVSSAINRLDLALRAAGAPDASPELVAIAEDELSRTQQLLRSAPDRLQALFDALDPGATAQDDGVEVITLVADQFVFAADIVDQQVVGEPPSTTMDLLTGLARANAGGLVLPYERTTRNVAFLYGSIGASIEYADVLDHDRAEILRGLPEFSAADFERLADAPLRTRLWNDVIDARQFAVAGMEDMAWAMTEPSDGSTVLLDRREPFGELLRGDVPATPAERDALMLRLLQEDEALRTDVYLAYEAIEKESAAEVAVLGTERTLTGLATVLVAIVGFLLLGLTIAEVRQRQRVERAHGKAIDQLADKADRDPTTGAWNRRRLERTLAGLLSSVEGTDEHVVLAYIDLDSFKAINDVWGHHTGDRVLRIVTERLQAFASGRVDFELIRFGGDEFVVYGTLANAGIETLERLGTDMLDVLSHPMAIEGREHAVSASVGLTMSDDQSTLDSLLLEADSSLILAKRAKRGTAIVYNRQVSRTGELVHALPTALSQGEVLCHLQPVYNVHTGEIMHAEALARWFRPSGEFVSPAVFVPLVESFGLAEQLTFSMLRSVASILDDPTFPKHLRIWVNLSPRELEVANFAARFIDAVQGAGVPPGRLGLEITETAAVRDPAALAIELGEVRRSGVQIAIDDFGNGYSPLGFLRDLPVDVVKLDRSLIANIDRDVANQHLVTGIVGMLDELGIAITAEGVERVEEESWLAEHGVHAIQGFLRGRPAAPSQLDWAGTARRELPTAGALRG